MGQYLGTHIEACSDWNTSKSENASRHDKKPSEFFIGDLKSSGDHRFKYQEAIPFPYHGSRFEVYHSQDWGLEPMENLEKLFTLSACRLNTRMTPLSELTGIITQLNSCGNLDNDNYFDWMNENNETPLEIAIKAGNTVMVGLLIERVDKDMHSEAFLLACSMGMKEIVNLLLEFNAHANLDFHVQNDCVIICTKHGYNHLLSILFDAGFRLSNADKFVDLKSPVGSVVPLLWRRRTNGSLLHIAAGNGHHQILDFLITHDAGIDSVDSSGRKPIHLAVQGGICCLMSLLRAGGNIDAVDSKGCTSLFLAASFGNLQAVKFLLNNGADSDSENDDGVSVLLAAALCNQDRTVKYLLDNGSVISRVYLKRLNSHTSGKEQEMNRAYLRKLEKTGNSVP